MSEAKVGNIEAGRYFPTPIWSATLADAEDLNQHLLQCIASAQKQDQQGRQRSNIGGWQSRDDLHVQPMFEPLFSLILEVAEGASSAYAVVPNAQPYIQNAWANVNYPGDANAPHIHASSAFSGVYYVRTAEGCGDIAFLDPRGGASMARPLYPQAAQNELTQPRVSFTPAPGSLFLFPGWLLHHVHPNQSRDLRVSIAFNIGFRPRA